MLTVRDTTLLGMGIDRDADRGVVASHAQVDHELPVDRIRGRVVSGLVIALAVVAVVGLVALWPRSTRTWVRWWVSSQPRTRS